jgi:hypothetical protein
MALPMATAANVVAPCLPANRVSTTLIAMDASWPIAMGNANLKLTRDS